MKKFVTLIFMALIGCAPVHKDPQVYWNLTQAQAAISAELHARDVGGMAFLVGNTGSMEPFLTGGDYTVVVKSPFESIQTGQILVYKADWLPADSSPVVHRAAEKDSEGWIMTGDANPRYENQYRVTPANYIGTVVAVYTTRTK